MLKNKRMKNATNLIDNTKNYPLDGALNFFLGDYAEKFKAKFDETIEIVMKLGIDPKHSDQMVRGAISMPHGLGKTIKVLVITQEDRLEDAKKAGADEYGSDELVAKIKSGYTDFDVCISSPDMMAKVGTLGKVLGPKGLMPNPKLGTVSDNIGAAVKAAKSGQVEFRAEKAGLIHAGVGKLSFKKEQLKDNIKELYDAVIAAKPKGAKGIYMQEMYISTSQGPSIRLDLSSMVN